MSKLLRFDELIPICHCCLMTVEIIKKIQATFPLIYFKAHRRHHPTGKGSEQLSQADYQLLVHVSALGATGTIELADHLHLSASTVSERLSYLVGLGLISKKQGDTDKRRFRFRLTTEGSQRVSTDSVLEYDKLEEIIGALTENEAVVVGQAFDLLKRAVTANNTES